MEKMKKINYVGIIDAIIFLILIFVPYIIIAGVELKIYGSDLTTLANIGAIPYEFISIFEIIHKYAMYIFIGIAVVLLVFSIFPITFFNVLFIIIGIFLSIVFVLLDVIGLVVYYGSPSLYIDLADKVSIGAGIILLTLGSIMMVATGIIGLNKNKNK